MKFCAILIVGKQWLIQVEMPCGEKMEWDLVKEHIPDHDVPCPCGDPDHWIIKFEEVR